MKRVAIALKQSRDIATRLLELFNEGALACNKREEKRSKQNFHVSGIGYCLRQTYFKNIAERTEEPDPDFLQKVNYGTAVHELLQKYLAHTGSIFGMWYCKKCRKISGPSFGGPCEDCKAVMGDTLRAYSEFTLINPKLRVSGHPDGFVSFEKNKVNLIEIKTASTFYNIGKGVEQVRKFVPEHIQQANFYLGLLSEPGTMIEGCDSIISSMFDHRKFILAYLDKGTDGKSAYALEFDKELYEKDKARVKKYWECHKAKTPPPAEQIKCKYCAYIRECNGVKHGTQVEDTEA